MSSRGPGGCQKGGQGQQAALRLFWTAKIAPDLITYNTAISACDDWRQLVVTAEKSLFAQVLPFCSGRIGSLNMFDIF